MYKYVIIDTLDKLDRLSIFFYMTYRDVAITCISNGNVTVLFILLFFEILIGLQTTNILKWLLIAI